MKILILGGGYIGNYISSHENSSHEIMVLRKSDLDYSNPAVLTPFLKGSKIDWIINCSGYTGSPNIEACEDNKEACYHYNVTVPLYITTTANSLKIPIIHMGSGCIFSGYSKKFTETDLSNFGANSHESPFYSKTKDAFEKLSASLERYIFRIRIPFNGVPESKNYIHKILHYDNLFNSENSHTNINDLVKFTYKFIEKRPDLGIYNVVNSGSIDTRSVISKLRDNNLENEKWKFVDFQNVGFKVARSNCILDTHKIKKIGLELPDINESMNLSIDQYRKHSFK